MISRGDYTKRKFRARAPGASEPVRRDQRFVLKLHGRNRAVGDPHPATSSIRELNSFVVEAPELAGRIHVDPRTRRQADRKPTKGVRYLYWTSCSLIQAAA
jgi:hypothetical protein